MDPRALSRRVGLAACYIYSLHKPLGVCHQRPARLLRKRLCKGRLPGGLRERVRRRRGRVQPGGLAAHSAHSAAAAATLAAAAAPAAPAIPRLLHTHDQRRLAGSARRVPRRGWPPGVHPRRRDERGGGQRHHRRGRGQGVDRTQRPDDRGHLHVGARGRQRGGAAPWRL